MAGSNYSAGNWEARERAEEPCGPALGLLHSGKRQRGHHRVWLVVPGSGLADGQMAMPVLDVTPLGRAESLLMQAVQRVILALL